VSTDCSLRVAVMTTFSIGAGAAAPTAPCDNKATQNTREAGRTNEEFKRGSPAAIYQQPHGSPRYC
jgi:hypothetical protein